LEMKERRLDFGGGRSLGTPRQRQPARPPVVAALRASSDEERAVAGMESEARDLGRGGSGARDQTCTKLERSWRLTRTVQAEKEKAKRIRWE
jgi:hypothetical protein